VTVTHKVFSQGMIDQSQSNSNFLALNVLFSRLKNTGKYRILDMGPARKANIDFFSHYQCSLYIEDLYRNTQEHPETPLIELLQHYNSDTRFDIILFWDLFDYIDQSQLPELIEHLSRYCKPDSMLFFLTWAMETIPQEPAKFNIIDQHHLGYENLSPTTRKAVGFKQAMYKKMLPGFNLYRGFRMSSGMEENLFVFDMPEIQNASQKKTAV